MCEYPYPHDEEAQQRHDFERKACSPYADDGLERLARVERAWLEVASPRDRQLLGLELQRLRAALGLEMTHH